MPNYACIVPIASASVSEAPVTPMDLEAEDVSGRDRPMPARMARKGRWLVATPAAALAVIVLAAGAAVAARPVPAEPGIAVEANPAAANVEAADAEGASA